MENDSFDEIIAKTCGSQDESGPEQMDTLQGPAASLSPDPATLTTMVADAASGGSANTDDQARNRRAPSPITWDELVQTHKAAEAKRERYRAVRDKRQKEEEEERKEAAAAADAAAVRPKDKAPKKTSAKEDEEASDDAERGARS